MQSVKIILILMALIAFSCGNKDKFKTEIHRVPNGYSGRILIIFDQKDGLGYKYENGSRVYEIPKSGILKTKFSMNDRLFNDKNTFFYYSNGEQTIKRLYLKKPGDFSSDSIVVFPMTGMSLAFGDIKYEHVVEYFVGIPNIINDVTIPRITKEEIDNWNSN